MDAMDGFGQAQRVRLGAGLSSEVYAIADDRVLKLYRADAEPEAVADEYRASRLAHAAGLPTAAPLGLVREGARAGIQFERLHGPTMLARSRTDPRGLPLALARLARIQRAMHAHAGHGLPNFADRLRADIGWARLPEAVRALALCALDRLPAGDRLCHGDIHLGNVLATPAGLRVIDWQKAGAGRPAADLARTLILFRHGRLPGRPDGRPNPSRSAAPAAARTAAAAWYGLCYRAAGAAATRAEVAAWRLPLLAAKLCSTATDQDDETLEAIDRLLCARRRGA